MDVTYFIRNNNNSYQEFCDVATIRLIKNEQTYYGGISWGHHQPTNIIEYINTDCNQINFNSWVNSMQYEIVVEELMV